MLGDRARNGWAGVAVVGFVLTLGAAIALTFDSPVAADGHPDATPAGSAPDAPARTTPS